MHNVEVNDSEVVYECNGLIHRDDIELALMEGRNEIKCKVCNKKLVMIRGYYVGSEYVVEYKILE